MRELHTSFTLPLLCLHWPCSQEKAEGLCGEQMKHDSYINTAFVGLQAFVLVLELDEKSFQNRTENWQIKHFQ